MHRSRIVGFDGVRGVAVALVVAFHLWPRYLPGGFLGVTLFFALSGYLITALLLDEVEQTGSISLRSFYERRIRRILPAALATASVVAVVWFIAGWATAATRREVFAAVLQVTNWQQIVDGGVYGAAIDRSPVLHYWSLAIEEQVYLVLPIVVMVARRRRVIAGAVGTLLAGSVVATALSAGDATVAYFSTFTRAGEMFAGAFLATLFHGRRPRPVRTTQAAIGVVGGASLGGLVALGVTTSLGTEPYYRGGLLLCGALAAAGVTAVANHGRLGAILDVSPLRWIGERSYGIYLVHWPILLAFAETGIEGRLVPVATIVATLSVASVSLRWFERPLRAGRVQMRRLAVVGAALVAVVPLVATLAPPPRSLDFDTALDEFSSLVAVRPSTSTTAAISATSIGAGATSPPPPGPTTTVPRRPVRIAMFGDSKMLTLGLGTSYVGPDVETVAGFAGLGCPLGRGRARRNDDSSPSVGVPPRCDWTTSITEVRATTGPVDLALVWYGSWDVIDVEVAALGDRWVSFDDVEYREWLFGEMVAFTDEVIEHTGARGVLWLTIGAPPTAARPEHFAAYNDLLGVLARSHPGVRIVDIAGWIASTGEAERLLPDSIHPSTGREGSTNTAAEIGERFLTAEILAAFDRLDAT